MANRTRTCALAALLLAFVGTCAPAVAAVDEAARTIAACGAPMKDTVHSAPGLKDGHERLLRYPRATIHFGDFNGAWKFTYADTGRGTTAKQADVSQRMSCFADVVVSDFSTAPIPALSPKADSGDGGMVGGIILLILAVCAYFLPCLIGAMRGMNNAGGLAALNILLGWTVLGWVVALIWACSGETAQEVQAREIDYNRLAAVMAAQHAAQQRNERHG